MKHTPVEETVENPNSYFTDEPIASPEFDRLGFSKIATALAKSIQELPNTTSTTLGLDGAWGSGKSSILRLLEHMLRKAPDLDEGRIGPIVVPFSPWLITTRTALISNFFSQIYSAIEIASERAGGHRSVSSKQRARAIKSVKKKLNGFSNLAAAASTAAVTFDPTATALATKATSNFLAFITRGKGKVQSMDELKSEISELLSEIANDDPSFRIVVIIDDLDRLEPAEALEVIRLVKALADFPALTYVLAYDRPVLGRAIATAASIDNGDAYLEKIIQFSFKVPTPEPFQLRRWFQLEILELYSSTIDSHSNRATSVFDRWAGRLLHTPRDVKRILFAVQVMWPNLKDRCDLLDLIWLQMLKEKAAGNDRDLYGWVMNYLQGLDAIAIGGTVTNQTQQQNELVGILKNLGWRSYNSDGNDSFDYHDLKVLLAGIDASYVSDQKSEASWIYQIGRDDFQKFRHEKRLSSPWHWRLYLALDVPSHALTDIEWDALVEASLSEDADGDLEEALSTLIGSYNELRPQLVDQVMDRIIHEIRHRHLEHSLRWVTAIITLEKKFESQSRFDNFFGLTPMFEWQSKRLLHVLFEQLTGTERTSALKKIFEELPVSSVVSRSLRAQRNTMRKQNSSKSDVYLTPDELTKIEKIFVKRCATLPAAQFRDLSVPQELLFAWHDISGADAPSKYFTQLLSKDADLVATLEKMKTVTSSEQNGIPRLVENSLKHFVDANNLYHRLQKLSKKKTSIGRRALQLKDDWWFEKTNMSAN